VFDLNYHPFSSFTITGGDIDLQTPPNTSYPHSHLALANPKSKTQSKELELFYRLLRSQKSMAPAPTPEEVDPEFSVTTVDTGDKMEDIELEHQDTTAALSVEDTKGELPSSSASAGDDKTEVSLFGDSHVEEKKGLFGRLVDFYFKNEFLIMILLAIALAKAYPPLGADYLKPKITATWVAVVIIFGTLV
jgi:hypothetical protein